MPLILRETFDQAGALGLWRIEESEAQLRNRMDLSSAEQKQLDAIMGEGRRKEFLAARHLLHQLSGRENRGVLIKDEFGKPHLDGSKFKVSISHTESLSAAVGHPENCGVDVQVFVSKIRRLAPRFMGVKENAQLTDANRLIFQHLVWSAKEAMYKAYGRRELDFREHLFVDLEGIPLESGQTTGQLIKDDLHIEYDLNFRIFERNYMLVAAVEKSSKIRGDQ